MKITSKINLFLLSGLILPLAIMDRQSQYSQSISQDIERAEGLTSLVLGVSSRYRREFWRNIPGTDS